MKLTRSDLIESAHQLWIALGSSISEMARDFPEDEGVQEIYENYLSLLIVMNNKSFMSKDGGILN